MDDLQDDTGPGEAGPVFVSVWVQVPQASPPE